MHGNNLGDEEEKEVQHIENDPRSKSIPRPLSKQLVLAQADHDMIESLENKKCAQVTFACPRAPPERPP